MKKPVKKIALKPYLQPGDFIISQDQKRIGRIRFVTAVIDAEGEQAYTYSAVFPQADETWQHLQVRPHGDDQGVENIEPEDYLRFDPRTEEEKLADDLKVLSETLYQLCHEDTAKAFNNFLAQIRSQAEAADTPW